MNRARGVDRLLKWSALIVVGELFGPTGDRRAVIGGQPFGAVNDRPVKQQPRLAVGEIDDLMHPEKRPRVYDVT